MTREEDFFKENFPEYVTEKGEYLTPYWDLFRAGVICDTFECKVKIEQLEKENAELDCQRNRNKSCYSCANATERCFRNEIGCPCQKYKSYKEENAELEKAYNETEELLDKQIEATYKVVEENNKLKEKAKDIVTALLNVFVYDLAEEELDAGHTYFREKAEQFLKELEK